jgi:hypothetical protein
MRWRSIASKNGWVFNMSKQEKKSPLKEKPLRYPGQSLDDQIWDKHADVAVFLFSPAGFIGLVIAEWLHKLLKTQSEPIFPTIFTIAFLIFCIYKVIKIKKEIELLKLGRDGEKIVAEQLEVLKKGGAAILHDIVGNNFNVDHVVISPRGIFVIETKTRSKWIGKNATIRVENQKIFVGNVEDKNDPIVQAKALSRWVSELLEKSTGRKFSIHPVVLFPEWFVESKQNRSEVWVLNPKALPSFIGNEPIVLKTEDVYLITYHLSQYIRSK